MALSGQIQTNTAFGYVRLAWSQNSQNVANNTTTIAYTLSINRTSAISSTAAKSYSIVINGVTVASGTTTIGGTGTQTIKTGTTTISHNADGTKTFALSFRQQIDITYSGSWIGTITGSGSGVLNTIPRATTPTLNTTSIDMGTTLTITLNRASANFTHNLTYGFGSVSGTIASGVAVNATWVVPLTFANQLPNGLSGTATITCKTYNGSALIGTKSVSVAVRVPSSVVPVINSVTRTEAGSTVISQFNSWVQHQSKMKVVTSANGAYASTIKKCVVTLQDGSSNPYTTLATYHGTDITTDTLIWNTTSIRLVVQVTDSRGRTASVAYNETLLAYTAPKITSFSAFRSDASGNQDYDSTNLKVTLNFAIDPVNELNGKYYEVLYKVKGATSWAGNVASGAIYSRNDSFITSGVVFSTDNAYELQLSIYDAFKSAHASIEIPTAFTLVDFRSTGKGIAFGKVSQKDAMEIALDVEMTGEFIQEDMKKPVLQNGWTDYGSATGYYAQSGYWIDKCGVVHLSGMIANGTVTSGTLLFTLPEGYRPAKTEVFIALSAGILCRIDVENTGSVLVQSGASAGWLSLSGITFKAT